MQVQDIPTVLLCSEDDSEDKAFDPRRECVSKPVVTCLPYPVSYMLKSLSGIIRYISCI